MTKWVLKGLGTGIVTTAYPDREEKTPGISPGRPVVPRKGAVSPAAANERCPTGAFVGDTERPAIDYRRCIHCFRCHRRESSFADWQNDYEWAVQPHGSAGEKSSFAASFHNSLHIRVVDAGACGACLHEIEQLNKPYYNIHRLGFFITPTPREADVLLVAGPVTDHMRMPLKKVYEAMPTPKKVVAVGTCALSGGVFGPSFASGGGVSEVIPVDVAVPGCPPPPLALIHALLLVVDRKPPATWLTHLPISGGEAHV